MTEYNKVVYDGQTLIDLTQDDVTASDVRSGVYFHSADGVRGQGTLTSTSVPTADTIAEWDSDVHMNSEDMTSQEVDDFVDSLSYSQIVAVDYIVEQGTSGIWTYRKWNSGVAECWGYTSVESTSYSANGGYKQVVESTPSIFIAGQKTLQASGNIAGTVQTQIGYTHISDTSVQAYLVNRAGSAVTATGGVYWEIKGRWK